MPWIISAAFDGEDNETNVDKLLKPGTTYKLARFGHELTLPSKKLSKHRVIPIEVSPFPPEKISDTSFHPTLFLHNTGDAAKAIRRRHADGNDDNIGESATAEILDGDLASIGSVAVVFRWEPLVCFVPHDTARTSLFVKYSEACVSLGIHLVNNPDPNVTHHVQSSVTADPLVASSLICSAFFVTPDWLKETIRLGELPREKKYKAIPSSLALQDRWKLPLVSRYTPKLPSSYPRVSTWLPDETRLNIFADFRFFCIGEKPRFLDTDTRTVVERGGAQVEAFDVHQGDVKFRKALSRAKAKAGKLILVTDKKAMRAAVDHDDWKKFEAHASEYGLHFCPKQNILKAIFSADPEILSEQVEDDPADLQEVEESIPQSESLPSVVPNSIPDEPTQPPLTQEEPLPTTRRKLPRRVTSRAASKEPEVVPAPDPDPIPEPETEAPRPRRGLKRRVFPNSNMITGLPDEPPLPDSQMDASEPEPTPVTRSGTGAKSVLDLHTPAAPRSTRLKRRVGVPTEEKQEKPLVRELTSASHLVEDERAAKRLRMLYEASDPNNPNGNADFERIYDETQDQTQQSSGDPFPPTTTTRLHLPAVREEEEETQASTQSSGSKKRKASSMEDPDSAAAQFKRRALEEARAVQESLEAGIIAGAQPKPKPPPPPPRVAETGTVKHNNSDKGKSGAEPGKPDQDAAFLQAVASSKNGKRKEDDFDREFNNLKIVKPPPKARSKRAAAAQEDVENEVDNSPLVVADKQARAEEKERQRLLDEEEDRWKILEDFDDGVGITGNFMTIYPIDVDYNPVRHRTASIYAANQGGVDNPEWVGKKNFKKFRRKENGPGVSDTRNQGVGQPAPNPRSKARIPLVVSTNPNSEYVPPSRNPSYSMKEEIRIKEESEPESESEDRSMRSRSRSQAILPKPSQVKAAAKVSSQRKRKASMVESDSDEVELVAPPTAKRAKSSRASSVVSTSTTSTATMRKSTRTTKSSSKKSQPLFLDSDEDVIEEDDEDQEQGVDMEMDVEFESQTLGTGRSFASSSSNSRRQTQPRAASQRKRSSARSTPTPVLDDDSDDDGAFKFTTRTRAKAKR